MTAITFLLNIFMPPIVSYGNDTFQVSCRYFYILTFVVHFHEMNNGTAIVSELHLGL